MQQMMGMMLMQQMQQRGGQSTSNPMSAMTGAKGSSALGRDSFDVIQMTQEEKAAIDRLKAMGFSEHKAVEAYIVCGKNEELAANYLFDNHHLLCGIIKLEQCNVKQLCYIIKHVVIDGDASELYGYREKIVEYFVANNIDGARFITLQNNDKNQLVQSIKQYLNPKDNKLEAFILKFIKDICSLELKDLQLV